MSKGKWFLLAGVFVVVVGAGVVLALVFLRTPVEKATAADIAKEVGADLEAARRKYFERWLEVSGKVESSIAVAGDDGAPYHTVFLETGRPLQIMANFASDAGLKEGAEITFEGHCTLCDPGVVQFDNCVIVRK
ncbi:MAG: hypothetical protein U0793_01935 [Gemmataceae bacterium]